MKAANSGLRNPKAARANAYSVDHKCSGKVLNDDAVAPPGDADSFDKLIEI